jgi:curved DNA-binding protein CbpA
MTVMTETIEQARPATSQQEFTPQQINSCYLELEGLLEHIERSITHYQVLDVDQTATHERICAAFHRTVSLLHPAYKISTSLPDHMLSRAERAFNRATRAFSVLAVFAKRTEYDSALQGRSANLKSQTGTLASGISNTRVNEPVSEPDPKKRRASSRPSEESINPLIRLSQQGALGDPGKRAVVDNRRRCERFKLSIPVRITGHDKKLGKWSEITEAVDVSRTGINIRVRRHLRNGVVLYLTLPLPTKLRAHGYTSSSYNVYALVRRVDPPKKGIRLVGLEFIGENPPTGYIEKPWAVYRTRGWTGGDRRRNPRYARMETLAIEYFSESMQCITKEAGRTEDISRVGARVCVRSAPAEFDFVRVSAPARGFECIAAVRNRFVGKDGIERLCLQFLNGEWSS